MGCIVEFSEPFVRFDFRCRNDRQKILIRTLLKYSTQNIAGIASLINVPIDTLESVFEGKQILSRESADQLLSLFLIFLSE